MGLIKMTWGTCWILAYWKALDKVSDTNVDSTFSIQCGQERNVQVVKDKTI